MTTHNLFQLSGGDSTNLTAGKDYGFDITVQNNSATDDIFLGGPDVNSESYGFKLSPGQAFSVRMSGEDDLYAYADNNGVYISTLQFALGGK